MPARHIHTDVCLRCAWCCPHVEAEGIWWCPNCGPWREDYRGSATGTYAGNLGCAECGPAPQSGGQGGERP